MDAGAHLFARSHPQSIEILQMRLRRDDAHANRRWITTQCHSFVLADAAFQPQVDQPTASWHDEPDEVKKTWSEVTTASSP
jgi:hypothetical protein